VNVKKGIRDKLNGNSTVTSKLASYDFGTGDSPAIFTTQVFPERTQYPAVIIRDVVSAFFGVRANRGSEVFIDVDVYGDREHSDLELINAADAVWDALDRQEITVSGYHNCMVLADSPVEVKDDEGFIGYVIRCRVVMLSES